MALVPTHPVSTWCLHDTVALKEHDSLRENEANRRASDLTQYTLCSWYAEPSISAYSLLFSVQSICIGAKCCSKR